MDELTVEVGVKESFKKKLVRSGLRWAGHVERMGDDKFAEITCTEIGDEKEAKKTENAMQKNVLWTAVPAVKVNKMIKYWNKYAKTHDNIIR